MPDTFWTKPCAYDEHHKRQFHRRAKQRLKELATRLGLQTRDYDLRSNLAGIAVSGEITLHAEHLYVQASQSAMGAILMYRTCKGRRDYVGGHNQFVPLQHLDDVPTLANRLKQFLTTTGAEVVS